MHFNNIGLFYPSLVFVATWDRVAAISGDFSGLVNTFQVVVASNGTWTFVAFNYGNIQWGGLNTFIGVGSGDGNNFITHPASSSSSVLLLDNSSAILYTEVGGKFTIERLTCMSVSWVEMTPSNL